MQMLARMWSLCRTYVMEKELKHKSKLLIYLSSADLQPLTLGDDRNNMIVNTSIGWLDSLLEIGLEVQKC